MILSIEQQFSGICRTLEEEVIPELSSPYIRGQVYSIMEILNQMQNWVEPRCDLMREEIEKTREVIKAISDGLESLGPEAPEGVSDFTIKVSAHKRELPVDGPALIEIRDETNLILDQGQGLFHAALEKIDPPSREMIESLLKNHLGSLARRNLKLCRPTLLGKISKPR